MKKTLFILIACIASSCTVYAQAPKWAEKARKAVFSIVTYDKENKIKSTGNGFYLNDNGTALSDYTLFDGAERAVIIGTDSKELPVTYILGANSMYDVVKFQVSADKKGAALIAAAIPAQVGETVYLLPYSTQKSATLQTGKVTRVDTIATNAYYYTLAMKTGAKMISCPIMNANGEVLGMIQKNASDESEESYAIGATYGALLNINALSVNDATLNRIGIKKALPDTEEQALVYLFMASSQQDADTYLNTLNDFVEQYPNTPDGYVRRATAHIGYETDEHNAQVDADLKKALEISTNKPSTQYDIAKLFYNYALALGEKPAYGDWGFEKALNMVREAIATDSQPVYSQLEGDILFAMGKYTEAYTAYEKINRSEMATPATFYAAAKAKQLTEGTDLNEVVALMDSAIIRFVKPYTSETAPYFYERAELKAQMGKFRDAVIDYNTFYDAIGGRVTATFYFQRQLSEVQCRMYQQAIDDITKATELEPENPTMWLEKGSVHMRVGQHNEAIEALKNAISLDPKAAAAYRMLGYSQIQLNQKKEARANFDKAKELGDEVVGGLIEKYFK